MAELGKITSAFIQRSPGEQLGQSLWEVAKVKQGHRDVALTQWAVVYKNSKRDQSWDASSLQGPPREEGLLQKAAHLKLLSLLNHETDKHTFIIKFSACGAQLLKIDEEEKDSKPFRGTEAKGIPGPSPDSPSRLLAQGLKTPRPLFSSPSYCKCDC